MHKTVKVPPRRTAAAAAARGLRHGLVQWAGAVGWCSGLVQWAGPQRRETEQRPPGQAWGARAARRAPKQNFANVCVGKPVKVISVKWYLGFEN